MSKTHPAPFLLALLLGGTALGPLLPMPATAQTSAARSYQIPAGPLSRALTAFGQQSGLQISFAAAATSGLQSGGLSGAHSPEAALGSLLAGTGLGWSYLNASTIAITAPEASGFGSFTPGATHLGQIVLYGDRSATTLAESRASVAVVQAQPHDAPAVTTRTGTFRRMANVQAGDWITSGFVIRGVNSEGLVPGGAGAPLASFYVDGVQQTTEGTRLGQRGMWDIQQVEVYRGPQSTLSGRAALAGAMYLRSVDPEFARSGAAQVTLGENSRRQVALAFGDHIGERFAYRISGEYSERQSDINYPSFERFERYEDFVTDSYSTLRARFLWLPGEGENTRVNVSLSRAEDSPTVNDIVGSNWSSLAPGYGERRGDAWGTLLPDFYINNYGLTELPIYQEVRDGQVDNLGIEVTHEISDTLRFTSVTSLTRSVTNRPSINLGTPGEFFITDGRFTQRTASQEFRLNYEDDRLRWVAGAYAARLNNRAQRFSQLLSYDQSRNSAEITNFALFGEASYEVSPGWRVTGGGRFDWIEQNQTAWYAENGTTTTDSASHFEDSVFLPRLGVEYTSQSGQVWALNYQQGYRPGGSDVRSSDGLLYSYEPETAHSLELAWRASFLDDNLRVAANLFYQDWRNQQVELITDPTHPTPRTTAQIFNAGRSESYGGEIELGWRASDRLDIFASVGLLRTRFRDFRLTSWNVDYSGMEFPGAPERSLALGFRWGEARGWFVSGAINHRSSQLSRLEQGVASPIRLAGFTTMDAEVGYAWDAVSLTAYGNNLFDRSYFTYEMGPNAVATLGERRELGIRMDYRF